MLYKFKVKKLLNLLKINNLDLNNLISSSNISIIITTKVSSAKRSKNSTIAIKVQVSSIRESKSKVIRRLSLKRTVAIRVSLKSSVIVISNTITAIIRYIFFANLESYRS